MNNDYIVAHQSPHYSNPNEIWYYTPNMWTDDVKRAELMSYAEASNIAKRYSKRYPDWTVWMQHPPTQSQGGLVVKDPAVAEGLKQWAEETKNVDNYDRAMRGIS